MNYTNNDRQHFSRWSVSPCVVLLLSYFTLTGSAVSRPQHQLCVESKCMSHHTLSSTFLLSQLFLHFAARTWTERPGAPWGWPNSLHTEAPHTCCCAQAVKIGLQMSSVLSWGSSLMDFKNVFCRKNWLLTIVNVCCGCRSKSLLPWTCITRVTWLTESAFTDSL